MPSHQKNVRATHAFAIFLLSFLAASSPSVADWKNANSPFDGTNKMTDESQIKWITVSDVQAACEKESRRRNFGGFGYPVQACTFWDKTPSGYKCIMITPQNPTIHNLGHEVRHCFQGNYH